MSTNHYVYVGPYLKTNQVTQTLPTRVPAQCSSSPRHMQTGSARQALYSSKFCSECGSPITESAVKPVTRTDFIHPNDVGEDTDFIDEMVTGETDELWMPNHGGFGHSYSDYEGSSSMALTPEGMQDAVTRMLERYKPFMDYMQAKYPGLTLTPTFGVIAYYR